MIRLIWSSMLARRANLAGSFLAVLIVVAAIYPAVILMKAGADGPDSSPRYGAVDLIVQVDAGALLGIDESLTSARPSVDSTFVEQVATVDGVARAVGDLDFYAQLLDQGGMPITLSDVSASRGMSWDAAILAPFVLVSGVSLQNDREVVIDQALADATGFGPGDEVTIISQEEPGRYTITGIAALPESAGMERQATVFFTDAEAHRLADASGTVDRIAVIAVDSADLDQVAAAIESALPGSYQILRGTEIARVDPASGATELDDFVALLGVMTGFVGFVAVFVIAATFGFSIQQRSREIGLQRAIGLTPGQVRRSIALEALLVTLAGSTIGIGVGTLLTPLYIRLAEGRNLIPSGLDAPFWGWALLIVIGGAIGISQIAVFGAARRASSIRPIEALRESSVQPRLIGIRRLIFGSLCIAGGLALFAVAPGLNMDEAVALSMGVAVLLLIGASALGPLIVIPFSAVAGWILSRLSGITGNLARWNARSMPQRVASVFSPLMLSIGFATLTIAFVATTQTATVAETRSRTSANIVVVPAADGLPRAVVSEIAAIPGVAAVNPSLPGTVLSLSGTGIEATVNELMVSGIEPGTTAATMNLEFSEGGLDRFDSGSVLLSEYAANLLKVSTGDSIELSFNDLTPGVFTVAGLITNELGLADVLMPIDRLAPHNDSLLVDSIYVALEPDASGDDARTAIEALGAKGYPLAVISGAEFSDAVEQSMIDGAWIIYLIIGAAAALAALSVINTMAMSIGERRREFAQLRLIGATPRQVMAMAGGEASIVVLIGSVTGVGIGILSVTGVSIGLTGDASALTVPLLPTLGLVVIGLAITLGSQLIPARRVLGGDPIREAGTRE